MVSASFIGMHVPGTSGALPSASPSLAKDTPVASRDGQAFSRHQAWLKAYEQAAQDARPAAHGTADSGGHCGGQADEPLDDARAKPTSAPIEANAHEIGHAASADASACPRPNDAATPSAAPGAAAPGSDGCPAASPFAAETGEGHAPFHPGRCLARREPHDANGLVRDESGRAEASSVETTPVIDALRRARAFAPMPEACVTVYQDASRLALAVRDARLSPEEGESILRRLSAGPLPASVKHVSVTLNGRRHHHDPTSEGN